MSDNPCTDPHSGPDGTSHPAVAGHGRRGRARGDADAVTPTVVRLRRPVDVVTAVPFLLGFVPADSLVVLTLAAGRVAGCARLDLPHADTTPAEVTGGVDALVRALAPSGPDDVVVVGYGSHDDVTAVATVLQWRLPWPVREVVRVEAGRWWSLSCDDPACCPPGSPLPGTDGAPDPVTDEVTAELLVASGSPASSRQALAAGLEPAASEVLDDVRALLEDPPAPAPASPASAGSGMTDRRRDAYATVSAAHRARQGRQDRPVAFTAAEAAAVLAAITDVHVRDACCGWDDEAALTLWQALVPLAPSGWVAPAATLLAVAAYQRGDGVLTGLALERALSDDPRYNLALLLDKMLTLAIPPAAVTDLMRQALRENPLLPR